MRFKEPLCHSRLRRNVDDGLRGLTALLAVVMIVGAMSSANDTDDRDDSESCSGTIALSTVAAAAEHDALSPEDQLLFLKVRGDAVADASSLTFVVFSRAARHHPLKTYTVAVIVPDRPESKTSCLQSAGKQKPPTRRVHFRNRD